MRYAIVLPVKTHIFTFFAFCLCWCTNAAIYEVTAFGAVGDGVTDDGEAVRRALAAAATNRELSLVTFPRATYRLGATGVGRAHMALAKAENLVIDGNGSTFIVTITQCTNVTIRRMEVEYAPRSFTQGTIRNVDAGSGTLELDIHTGYPSPIGQATNRVALATWQWGVVFDPVERHRKWELGDHFFLEAGEPLLARSNRFQITVTEPYKKGLQAVKPGDRFALPLKQTEDGKGTQATNYRLFS
jgi:hypothetical protein